MPSDAVLDAVARLAARDMTRTEADLQADIYLLLTSGSLALDSAQVVRLEVPTGDGTRRRLDVEVGHCVIEVKKDLRNAGVRRDAEQQLAGYVATQSQRLGTRYVGILTDGTDWYLYNSTPAGLMQVASLSVGAAATDAERLLVWLEAILATQEAVRPTPEAIQRRLGASSPAHLLDHASLALLYEQASSIPEVELKRQLWSKLLRTAFGKAFSDDQRLFVDHTLLVLTAEIIAHAVVGFDVSTTGDLTPAALAQGVVFSGAQIHGAVEADFFDWVLHVEGGPEFVRQLADRVARFDWSHVEHDVLKVLYEEVIPQEDRASLGEYYTPDWLADRVVASTVTDPLNQRVLDPSCGSGTFLFHAVRAYLTASDNAGVASAAAVAGVAQKVYGIDIHPVAVTLARVTYLLAIGRDRLSDPDRGPLSIPVYLGDSVQWEQRRDLLGGVNEVRISTTGDELVEGGGGLLFGDDLVFPRRVLQDAGNFDRLVNAMAEKVLSRSTRRSADLIAPVLRQFGIHPDDASIITNTFDTMRRLHAVGRDHIWGYYARNLIRPLWLSELDQQVDVLIGNPPWLRYSKMTAAMQDRYKDLSRERGLLTGRLGASGRDLSTLFVVRAVELYLKPSGRFAFVMPHGTLTRKPHDGFRSGRWGGDVAVQFAEPWDLTRAPTGFPMVSCVIRGRSRPNTPRRLPANALAWSSRSRNPNMTWETAKDGFTTIPVVLSVLDDDNLPPASPYKRRFRQGAVLAPRALLFVEEAPSSPIGFGAGRIAVRARRTAFEKAPWKGVQTIHSTVERAFVRPVHLGETLVPFRMLDPLRAVLPIGPKGILEAGRIEDYPGLESWWKEAEETWQAHKVESDDSSLLQRINFHSQLSAQVPAGSHRVVYSKAGNSIAAARLNESQSIIDHKLYWAAVSGVEEARYLVSILNSTMVLERVRPLQALGLFGGRDIDKNVFAVPIPSYDASDKDHRELASLSLEAETLATGIDLTAVADFKRARRIVRQELVRSRLAERIDEAVARVIPPVETTAE
ncbi:N-6 DNA methylase [Micromonospora aurantiaca (nom. illeg.)]|uniref:N-6 DNA methylase n=1 Tax=Micromonospora aurantiaca (nom. illeg.) TaxID=47850 RepID=UPI0016571293|nr:N-6 DNA methylase [Micromonospora aurantiaca]MBC9000853.1 N-6 DNA methylase [Micromonospora aurantiaca]